MKKLVLITGAAGLLGREHVISLLDSGYDVVATDISMDALAISFETVQSDRLVLCELDVTNEDQIKRISNNYDFDVLINNAAIDAKVSTQGISAHGRLEDFSVDNFNLEINVGLTGAILCSKYIGNKMNNLRGGKIINIASDLSIISPDQRIYEVEGLDSQLQPKKPVSYSVIKHGLVGLTKYLATYWPEKVTCNALSPGGVYTNQSEDFVEKISARIPQKRMAKMTEYRGILCFLVSDDSNYLNGQNIVMDGGRSVW